MDNPNRIIALIRHGKTADNFRGAYIGRLNPPLSSKGIKELRCVFPNPDIVISSPMLRCLQTADALYPNLTPIVFDGLKERDFGDLEGLTHKQIIKMPGFEDWGMDSSRMPFPNGEKENDFFKRCSDTFLRIIDLLEKRQMASCAIVTHGGVIMSILADLFPSSAFHSWQVSCGAGWVLMQHSNQFKVKPLTTEGS